MWSSAVIHITDIRFIGVPYVLCSVSIPSDGITFIGDSVPIGLNYLRYWKIFVQASGALYPHINFLGPVEIMVNCKAILASV